MEDLSDSLSRINRDIIVDIFGHLTFLDIYNIARTSHAYKHRIFCDMSHYKVFHDFLSTLSRLVAKAVVRDINSLNFYGIGSYLDHADGHISRIKRLKDSGTMTTIAADITGDSANNSPTSPSSPEVEAIAAHMHVVQALISHRADLTAKDHAILRTSLRYGWTPLVRRIITQFPDSVNSTHALTTACFHGHLELVSLLISSKSYLTHYQSHEPLFCAVHTHNRALVNLLLKHNAKVSQMTLFEVISQGDLPLLKELTTRDMPKGYHMLSDLGYEATMSGHVDILKFVLELENNDGMWSGERYYPTIQIQTTISRVCELGRVEMLKFLLEKYRPTLDAHGLLELINACANGHVGVIKLLLEYDEHCLEHVGQGFEKACQRERLEVVQFLMDLGVKEEHFKKVFHRVCLSDKVKVVMFILKLMKKRDTGLFKEMLNVATVSSVKNVRKRVISRYGLQTPIY